MGVVRRGVVWRSCFKVSFFDKWSANQVFMHFGYSRIKNTLRAGSLNSSFSTHFSLNVETLSHFLYQPLASQQCIWIGISASEVFVEH